MHLPPNQLAALTAILRHGSFEGAASACHVSAPAISQRIRALEEHLGGPVVTRTTPVEATELGARIAQHAEQVALLEAELAQEIGQTSAPGRVRIAVNADSLDTWFLPALAGTSLQIELVVDDQAHSLEWLRRGEVSAAVTDAAQPAQGADVYALGALRYSATASPDFFNAHFSEGLNAEALARAPMLQYSLKDRLQHDWLRRITGKSLFPPTHVLPSTRGFVTACELGLGWGLNPKHLTGRAIRRGRLIELHPEPMDTALYWQVSRRVSEPLAGLTRAVRKAAAASLVPAGDRP